MSNEVNDLLTERKINRDAVDHKAGELPLDAVSSGTVLIFRDECGNGHWPAAEKGDVTECTDIR